MIINITNTTDTILSINDLTITLLPHETKDIALLKKLYEISSSDDLVKHISSGKIIVNNGTDDLTITEAIQFVVVQKETGPTDIADKPWVHQSSRPFGTVTYFTGAGDNLHSHTPGMNYGHGTLFENVHTEDSTATLEYVYFDFLYLENKTFLHEGYITWSGAQLDTVSMEVVPRVTNVVLGSNTFFNLYNGYMVIPAAGDGFFDVPEIDMLAGTASLDCGFIYMPLNELGQRSPAFWNATYDPDNHIFINVAPAPFGDGEYNMFAAEIPLFRFINRIPLLESGFLCLQTSDVEEIGHGMRVRAVLETRGEQHPWKFAAWLTLNRAKTV